MTDSITTWEAIKRTPVDAAKVFLTGAAILPGIRLLIGDTSALGAAFGTIGGCALAILIRAVIVSTMSKTRVH